MQTIVFVALSFVVMPITQEVLRPLLWPLKPGKDFLIP